jgi:uncharacterized membrane protein YphA (DoxX/SURF4 family)
MTDLLPLSFQAVQLFIIISFLIYGASCFLSEKNKREFERYRLSHLRKVTGSLQLAACAGLLLGFYFPWFTTLTSLGLTAMMFFALFVRLRLKDSFLATAPAILYLLLSLFLFFSSL